MFDRKKILATCPEDKNLVNLSGCSQLLRSMHLQSSRFHVILSIGPEWLFSLCRQIFPEAENGDWFRMSDSNSLAFVLEVLDKITESVGVQTFHWADYLIFTLSLVISLAIGVYFAVSGDRQRTTEEFLLASRNAGGIMIPSFILCHQFGEWSLKLTKQ